QVDLVTDDMAKLRRVAKAEGWRVSAVKRAFVIQGANRVGVVHRQLRKLATAGINVTAVDAVGVGSRYGMILWVKPRDYARAARVLRAR
ncbi:MAG: hypothetical protein ABFS41_18310, partial [Myxococcota bacterium]